MQPPLDDAIQHKWLVQHIPHRIRAALPRESHQMPHPWTVKMHLPALVPVRCIANSVHEGRHGALRWLIYFVGITEQNGKAIKTRFTTNPTDVWIERFKTGSLFDLNSPDAVKLALVWRGCTQATGHPTEGTQHPDIREAKMNGALLIIIDHLQKTIYAAQGRSLGDDTLRVSDAP